MGFTPVQCPTDCIYRGMEYTPGKAGCNYLGITGSLRGCDPGPGCARYQSRTGPAPSPISKEIVVGKARGRRRPAWDTALGYKLYREGKSYAQIAATVGATRDTVAERANRCWKKGHM